MKDTCSERKKPAPAAAEPSSRPAAEKADHPNEALWFRYEMRHEGDTEPCLRVLILKEDNTVLWRAPGRRLQPNGEGYRRFRLTNKQLESIRFGFSCFGEVFHLSGPSRPEVITSPAHYYTLYFDEGSRQAGPFENTNLEEMLNDQVHYPNTNKVVACMEQAFRVLIEAGVDPRCFFPRIRSGFLYSPRQKTFWLYDIAEPDGKRQRSFTRPNGESEWLEHYYFSKDEAGNYAMHAQAGWGGWAASNNGGAGMTREIPPEWLTLTWEGFLDKFEEEMPTGSYFYSREELAPMEELKEFLGFKG